MLFSASGAEFFQPEVNNVFREGHSLGCHVQFSVGGFAKK